MCTAVTEDIFFLIMRELLEVNKEWLLDAGWLSTSTQQWVCFPRVGLEKSLKMQRFWIDIIVASVIEWWFWWLFYFSRIKRNHKLYLISHLGSIFIQSFVPYSFGQWNASNPSRLSACNLCVASMQKILRNL